LRAGPLSLRFEDGGLRYIHFGDQEVVRRVYVAVRDANWGTVPSGISNLRSQIGEESFQIDFDVSNRKGEIDFTWHGSIRGESSGRITLEMDGVANSTFLKNRIGFCILHPMELAAAPVTLVHANGSTESTAFPQFIAANNPFLDIVGLRHAVTGGAELAVTFEGDVFETEDQRNWIDASYKTFCTPLSRPFPAEVRAGEKIWQRVTIELAGHQEKIVRTSSPLDAVTLELASTPSGPLPQIGFSLGADVNPLSPREIDLLKRLSPAHLRVDLRLDGEFQPTLRQAAAAAQQLGCRLDAVLYVGQESERALTTLLSTVEEIGAPIARWTIFPAAGWSTTPAVAGIARQILEGYDSSLPIGGGTPANFRELNAQRPPIDLLDFVTWSLNPQVHAFDEASMVETLAAHSATVESARQFSGNLPLIVGPVTLKMQVNPYATGPWPPPTPAGQLPIDVDPRQLSLFAAGWTLGGIKYLAEAGVLAATYYELVGWKGLMEREAGSSLPDLFPSTPGDVFPLYHVFADLNDFAGGQVIPVRSSAPLQVHALALAMGQLTAILVANLTPQPQNVTIPHPGTFVGTRLLDQETLATATTQPDIFRQQVPWATTNPEGRIQLKLPAYALARLVIS
jgi:hypothetical protein